MGYNPKQYYIYKIKTPSGEYVGQSSAKEFLSRLYIHITTAYGLPSMTSYSFEKQDEVVTRFFEHQARATKKDIYQDMRTLGIQDPKIVFITNILTSSDKQFNHDTSAISTSIKFNDFIKKWKSNMSYKTFLLDYAEVLSIYGARKNINNQNTELGGEHLFYYKRAEEYATLLKDEDEWIYSNNKINISTNFPKKMKNKNPECSWNGKLQKEEARFIKSTNNVLEMSGYSVLWAPFQFFSPYFIEAQLPVIHFNVKLTLGLFTELLYNYLLNQYKNIQLKSSNLKDIVNILDKPKYFDSSLTYLQSLIQTEFNTFLKTLNDEQHLKRFYTCAVLQENAFLEIAKKFLIQFKRRKKSASTYKMNFIVSAKDILKIEPISCSVSEPDWVQTAVKKLDNDWATLSADQITNKLAIKTIYIDYLCQLFHLYCEGKGNQSTTSSVFKDLFTNKEGAWYKDDDDKWYEFYDSFCNYYYNRIHNYGELVFKEKRNTKGDVKYAYFGRKNYKSNDTNVIFNDSNITSQGLLYSERKMKINKDVFSAAIKPRNSITSIKNAHIMENVTGNSIDNITIW